MTGITYRNMGRPAGTYGDVARALCHAASQGPATVRALAERAQVGYSTARYTASRLCDRGELVVLDGGCRPAVLATPSIAPMAPTGDSLGNALAALHRSFWDMPPSSTASDTLEDDDPGGI